MASKEHTILASPKIHSHWRVGEWLFYTLSLLFARSMEFNSKHGYVWAKVPGIPASMKWPVQLVKEGTGDDNMSFVYSVSDES